MFVVRTYVRMFACAVFLVNTLVKKMKYFCSGKNESEKWGKTCWGKMFWEMLFWNMFFQKISSRKMAIGKTERGTGKTTEPSAVVNRQGPLLTVKVCEPCRDVYRAHKPWRLTTADGSVVFPFPRSVLPIPIFLKDIFWKYMLQNNISQNIVPQHGFPHFFWLFFSDQFFLTDYFWPFFLNFLK